MLFSWSQFKPLLKSTPLPSVEPRIFSVSEISEIKGEPIALTELVKLTPQGFVLPAAFVQAFWQHQNLDKKIKAALVGVNLRHPRSLASAADAVTRLIVKQTIPTAWQKEWSRVTQELTKKNTKINSTIVPYFSNPEVGPVEWLPENRGLFSEAHCLKAVKQALAALYSERFIREREQRGWSHAQLPVSLVVSLQPVLQKNSRQCTIKISTTDPISSNAALARVTVATANQSEHYLVFKPALGTKKAISINHWSNQIISEAALTTILAPFIALEKKYQPVSVSGDFDPVTSQFHLTRLDFATNPSQHQSLDYVLKNTSAVIGTGTFLGQGIAVGPLFVCRTKNTVPESGSIIVAKNIAAVPVEWLAEAAGLILEENTENAILKLKAQGSTTPILVGVRHAVRKLRSGVIVTMAMTDGVGTVYTGALSYEVKPTKIITKKTNTELRSPQSVISVDELITQIGGRHPLDYCRTKQSASEYSLKLGQALAHTAAQQFPQRFTVALSSSVGTVFAAWHGGAKAERQLHVRSAARGAERYLHPQYKNVFEAEITALKQARERFGLTNFDLQLPYCRSGAELEEVLAILTKEGLTRAAGWRFSLATDVPGHALLTEALAKQLDELIFDIDSLVKSTTGERFTSLTPVRQKTVETALLAITKVARKERARVALSGSLLSREPKLVFSAIKTGIKTLVLEDHQLTVVRTAALEAERNLGNTSGTNRQLLSAVAGFACLCAMLITVGSGCGTQTKVPESPQMTPAQIRAEIMSALAEEREKNVSPNYGDYSFRFC